MIKNTSNIDLFEQSGIADEWVWVVRNRVAKWVKDKGNKSLWREVLYVSKQRGLLKSKVSIQNFAKLLFEECRDVFGENETDKTLFHSMEKYEHKNSLRKFSTLGEANQVRRNVMNINALFDMPIPQDASEPPTMTATQRLGEFLTNRFAKGPYDKVVVNPCYDGKTASFSIEQYVSSHFYEINNPSSIVVFQCCENGVTEETVELFAGRFSTSKKVCKVFLASTSSFSLRTRSEAEKQNMGLIYVNPECELTEENIVMARSASHSDEEEAFSCMLNGECVMTEPMLVYDGRCVRASLSDVLYELGFGDNSSRIEAPYWSDSEIEKIASGLVMRDIDHYVSLLDNCGENDCVPNCIIDPYRLAKELGLKIVRKKLGMKLGGFNEKEKTIYVSARCLQGSERERYSVGHEEGHYIFHSKVYHELMRTSCGVDALKEIERAKLECQANFFASCLLMPRPVIIRLYNIYWKKYVGNENVGKLVVNADFYRDKDFQKVVGPIARRMKVSLQAAKIRLENLKLIKVV
jgi:Zn-dependent peptidase ImmA (M78 family)